MTDCAHNKVVNNFSQNERIFRAENNVGFECENTRQPDVGNFEKDPLTTRFKEIITEQIDAALILFKFASENQLLAVRTRIQQMLRPDMILGTEIDLNPVLPGEHIKSFASIPAMIAENSSLQKQKSAEAIAKAIKAELMR